MTNRSFFLTFLLCGATMLVNAQHRDYPIQAIPFTAVKLSDDFWQPRIKTNHDVTIRASFERCESTGRVRNFEMAAARSGEFCTVFPFDDTDIYKTIEGASFSLSLYPDKDLEAYIDVLIEKIGHAQEPDGYLYTARTINPTKPHAWAGSERWERERELSHELYNAGHLYEAAAAHFAATGKRNLLDIALKNADLICSVFGPGGRRVAPGHQVIEMGLVKLYRITGKEEYLTTAKEFILERGHYDGYDSTSHDPFRNGAYWQDHVPVVEQDEAVGHAVRAGYLYAAMADMAALTDDPAMLTAVDRIWDNVVSKKIYVQGGIGASGHGERFGDNYELPNRTAYNETCAAIANVYWNHRMFLLHGDAKYIDVLEKTLYNGLLSGVGMDGKSFFYTNAMEISNHFEHRDMEMERSGWFPCSCCPTNVTRLIPSVPGYMYAQKGRTVYINLFAESTAKFELAGKEFQIEQENNYPWEGELRFIIDASSPVDGEIRIRIPGWARGQAIPSDLYRFGESNTTKPTIHRNGKEVDYRMENGYAVLSGRWKRGDKINVSLPMNVHRVYAHNDVKDDRGKVALQRGPIIYCAEWPDNGGTIGNLVLPTRASITAETRDDLLSGVVVLKSEAVALKVGDDGTSIRSESQPFLAIPYYAWAHRGKGEMSVWLPERISAVEIITNSNHETKSNND